MYCFKTGQNSNNEVKEEDWFMVTLEQSKSLKIVVSNGQYKIFKTSN